MTEENKQDNNESKYFKIKKFHFIMGVFLVVFLSVGITAAALLVGDEKVQPTIINDREEFARLYEAYDILQEKYYKDLDDEALVEGAIDGMVDALDDPYSDFMNKEEASSFNEVISSSFEGIGAEITQQNSKIVIVSPIKGTPAEKAGLQPNDVIVSVDGTDLTGVSSSEAVKLIKGEKGTTVTLVIQRGSAEPFTVKLVRDTIPIQTVYAEMLDNGIAQIHLTTFSTSTTDELVAALEEMSSQGMKGLVLDLRGNPGGIMEQAINIANMFVPEGKTIFQVEDPDGNRQVYKADGSDKIDVPIVILVDNGSASASEIVAAAAKESAGIKVIGETTYGKGTVQTAQEFNDGSNLKYTSAKWLTPDGNWIHEKGIQPDEAVALPEYAQLTYISPDVQLGEGSNATEVKVAEQMLEALGYNPGTVDSLFDEKTQAAVEQFQKDAELEVNGVLTGDTTTALMNKLRELILENDTQLEKAEELLSTSNN
ncbi:S41 family peptidase [Bacillus sp. AGMB 02131]|uniref:S41 family peptidase n=1 Tax=Peribacillus faecalis TaxID=2772559 RepID=A0A927CY73_9BACI|nr:S41 family peptidase [Peribacillus faecalis]MBD3109816.1 S41 family peptidase [Peribacillus faecalis]